MSPPRSVNAADISGANYNGVVANPAAADVANTSIHDIVVRAPEPRKWNAEWLNRSRKDVMTDAPRPVGWPWNILGHVHVYAPPQTSAPNRFEGEYRVLQPDGSLGYRPGDEQYFQHVLSNLSHAFSVGHVGHAASLDVDTVLDLYMKEVSTGPRERADVQAQGARPRGKRSPRPPHSGPAVVQPGQLENVWLTSLTFEENRDFDREDLKLCIYDIESEMEVGCGGFGTASQTPKPRRSISICADNVLRVALNNGLHPGLRGVSRGAGRPYGYTVGVRSVELDADVSAFLDRCARAAASVPSNRSALQSDLRTQTFDTGAVWQRWLSSSSSLLVVATAPTRRIRRRRRPRRGGRADCATGARA